MDAREVIARAKDEATGLVFRSYGVFIRQEDIAAALAAAKDQTDGR